jgi:hypothetical protein
VEFAIRSTFDKMRYLNGTAFQLVVAERLRRLRPLVDYGTDGKERRDHETCRKPQHQLRLQGPEPGVHPGCSISK